VSQTTLDSISDDPQKKKAKLDPVLLHNANGRPENDVENLALGYDEEHTSNDTTDESSCDSEERKQSSALKSLFPPVLAELSRLKKLNSELRDVTLSFLQESQQKMENFCKELREIGKQITCRRIDLASAI